MSLQNLVYAVAVVGGCVVFANTATACAPAYAALDNELWKDAKESGSPTRWVQYFVSQGCDLNKQAALALLKPLLGDATGSGSAENQIVLSGKFGSDIWEAAVNGQPLKSATRRAGAQLDGFHMRSKLLVHDCVSHYQSKDYCICTPTADCRPIMRRKRTSPYGCSTTVDCQAERRPAGWTI